MNNTRTITAADIEEVLQCSLGESLREQCRRANLRYQELNPEERDSYILEILDALAGDGLVVAGEKRLPQWEDGWGENLNAFQKTGNADALIPRYHGKHRLLHWKQQIIRPLVPEFDYHVNCLLVDWVVETYLAKVSELFEFGCGPAYHLLRARRFNQDAQLIGLDWAKASQEIIASIAASGIDHKIRGHRFNFYEPDEAVPFGPDAGVLTVAALEQVGERFDPFLQFLLRKRPVICAHIEPIDELMDTHNLIDRLSVLYCRKRNYLKGFLPRLRQLQDEGKIKIVREQRTYTGSFFIEGHSLVVWHPI
jgi:hypothetical protein